MIPKNVNAITRIVAGACIGTLAGSIGATLLPQRRKIISAFVNQQWIEKAKNMSESILNEIQYLTNNKRRNQTPAFTYGTITGLLLGVTGMMLLKTMSSGKFQKTLTKQYKTLTDKTHNFMEYLNDGFKKPPKKSSHPKRAPKKSKTHIKA